MCNSRFIQVKSFLVFFGLLVLISGCMPSHSDTLVFGTSTKFAVDLSLSSTTNSPSLTVGYSRQEGVWMPLYVNARDSKFGNFSSSKTFKNFSSNSNGLKYVGNQGGDRDTYSVMASFGADIKAGSEATVGIAQYFATGLAARHLAKNERVAETLSIQSPDKQTLDAQKKATENLEKALTYKELLDAQNVGNEQAIQDNAKIELIVKNLAPDGQVKGLENFLAKKELSSIEKLKKQLLATKTADELRNVLKNRAQSAIDPIFNVLYKIQAVEAQGGV